MGKKRNKLLFFLLHTGGGFDKHSLQKAVALSCFSDSVLLVQNATLVLTTKNTCLYNQGSLLPCFQEKDKVKKKV